MDSKVHVLNALPGSEPYIKHLQLGPLSLDILWGFSAGKGLTEPELLHMLPAASPASQSVGGLG